MVGSQARSLGPPWASVMVIMSLGVCFDGPGGLVADRARGGRTAVTLSALTVRVAGMVAALERAAGPQATGLIDWVPDPAVTAMVTGWPARIRAD